MTGYPLLDQGLACDGQEGNSPGCFLDEREAGRLLDMIERAGTAFSLAMVIALGNVLVELKTKHKKTWGPWHEIAFLLLTTAAFGPLGSMGASAAARAAAGLAVRGATKAAWTAAGIGSAKIVGALTMMSKGVRSALAHRGTDAPTNQVEFIGYLQDHVPGFTENLIQGIAEQKLNDEEMLELLARLQDPELVGRSQIERRARTLLAQFDDNRIGAVGNVMELRGGYEVAAPVRVKVRGDEYLVLCESYGTHQSALGLNGANLDGAKPPLTMESLVFVKIVEPAFYDLMTAEYKAKRKQDVPYVDFNKRSERQKHRWFDALYIELLHNLDARKLAITRGDGVDDVPDEAGGANANGAP